MDGPRFDDLARTASASRRGTVKALLSSALGVVFFAHGRGDATGVCKKVGQNCARTSDCCDGAKCQGGECQCKSGRDECNGKCFNLATDERRCGACDIACAAGFTCCGGACLALQDDRDNCGACGVVCPANEVCASGNCQPCPGGVAPCGNECCLPFLTCCDGACEEDLDSNPNHCGACGNRCPGICSPPPGPIVCTGPRCCSRGECVADFQSNRGHCGACENKCAADETCCDGECHNLDFSEQHCGACGGNCGAGRICCQGECLDEIDADDICGPS